MGNTAALLRDDPQLKAFAVVPCQAVWAFVALPEFFLMASQPLLDVIKPSFADAKNMYCHLIVPALEHFGGRQCLSENAAWIRGIWIHCV